jgi:hypothetical protein
VLGYPRLATRPAVQPAMRSHHSIADGAGPDAANELDVADAVKPT